MNLNQQFYYSKETVSPEECQNFKKSDILYWTHPEYFKSLISNIPGNESVLSQIHLKKKFYNHRIDFFNIIQDQYQLIDSHDQIWKQIFKLKSENCFAITCAHQPSVFGGPLYWWYKIIHTIAISQHYSTIFPEYNFVPIYFIGSEDHDFEEINHIKLFEEVLVWKQTGIIANGRRSTSGISDLVQNITNYFQNDQNALLLLNEFNQLKKGSRTYSEFYLKFVHKIFGSFGLICFNPDDEAAKKIFQSVLFDEIANQSSNTEVQKSLLEFTNLGLTTQAFSRPINLFYHSADARIRIEKRDQVFQLIDGTKEWTEKQLMEEIASNPKAFSPNVILRPIYQEILIPSILFIGGGAEIQYWMQLKGLFTKYEVPYPILQRRFSAFVLSKKSADYLNQFNIVPRDLLLNEHELTLKFLSNQSEFTGVLDQLETEMNNIIMRFNEFAKTYTKSDFPGTQSQLHKIQSDTKSIVTKIRKDRKRQFEQELEKIFKIRSKFITKDSIQERVDSGLIYYLKYGNIWIENLIEICKKDQTELYIIIEKK